MQITEFLPFDFPNRSLVLKGFENYSVEEYLDHFKSLVDKGVKVNMAYQRTIDYIIANWPLCLSKAIDKPLDEVEVKLREIPVGELKQYYEKKPLDGIIPKLENLGVCTLADLYRKPLPLGRKKDIELGGALKKIVQENYEVLVRDWEEVSQVIELPTKSSNNVITDALIELTQRVIKRQNQLRHWEGIDEKWNKVLYLTFIEGLNVREIANRMGYKHSESPRKILMNDILKPLFAGETLFENIKLRNDLIEKLSLVKSKYIFQQESSVVEFLRSEIRDEVAKVIGIDFVNVTDDIRFVIPIDSKRVYDKVVSVVLDRLRNEIGCKDSQVLFEQIIKSNELLEVDYDQQFIRNLLSCKSIVDITDKGVQIHECLLATNEQRIARIIYDVKQPITRENTLEIYKAKYGIDITTGLHTLGKFNIKNTHSIFWEYVEGGQEQFVKLEPLETRVVEFATARKIFLFDELLDWLSGQSYTIPSKATIRTYITNVCVPSNKNGNLFCHKDFVQEYSQYSWRETNRDGLTNWVLNQLNEMFNQQGKDLIKIIDAVDYIEDASLTSEYNSRIRQRAKAIIMKYSGEKWPFLIEDDCIKKNNAIYQETDFDIIGFKGENVPYYSQIRALASNFLKHTEDGRFALAEFIKVVNDSGFDKEISRKTIISAINSTRFPDCNVRLRSYENTVYLENIHPVIDTVSSEPSYKVVASSLNVDGSEVIESNQLTERSNVTYRQAIDWDKFVAAINLELQFYNNWLEEECNCSISDGIKMFISYIKQSTNSNLNQTLPRNLYEYWYAHIDNYDRCTYLTNISIFYEAILTEILNRRGLCISKKGLVDLAKYFPYLENANNIEYRDSRGFARIFKNLHYQRNKYAHGNAVELSARGIAQSIADFLALYVFTIVKYA